MKDAAARSKQLAGIVKKWATRSIDEIDGANDPIAMLVYSFLLWECNTAKAQTAYRSILDNVVDFNDLRVSMPHELIGHIGLRYPRAEERCERLRATLRDVYVREHVVSLERLNTMGKREVRKYLDSLEGMVPYVSARVSLLCFDAHAVPVDEQLRDRLATEEIIDPDSDLAEVASWLERQIKASDGPSAHFALQAWVENGRGRRTTARRGGGTKKTRGGKSAAQSPSKKNASGPKRKTTRKSTARS